MKSLQKLFFNHHFLLVAYVLAALMTALQHWLLPFTATGYTHYNNYVIFKNSFNNLLAGNNLYLHYPDLQFDLFKYSPTFALLMAPFALLPDLAGLMLWNLLNALVFWLGLRALPLSKSALAGAGWFCLIELITSLQNLQTNALIAGLLLLAFAASEQQQPLRAASYINLTVFIKLFGMVAFLMFFFSRNKKMFAAGAVSSAIALFLLPLMAVPFSELLQQYRNWWQLLQMDYAGSLGFSVAGWLQSWFGLSPPKHAITLAGALMLLLPLLRYRCFANPDFRLTYLCAVMVWMIIFNHKAESATFIIAVAAVAVWYFSQPRNNVNTALMVLVFLFTVLAPVDIYPHWLRHNILVPYVVKVVPCILIWLKILFDLMRMPLNPAD